MVLIHKNIDSLRARIMTNSPSFLNKVYCIMKETTVIHKCGKYILTYI